MAWVLDQLTLQAGHHLLSTGSQPFSSPMHGISAARQWTMSFRNDEQIESLDEMFEDQLKRLARAQSADQDPHFFETVVFECPVEASLNWKLTRDEQELIELGFGRLKTGDTIKDYLSDGDSRDRIEALKKELGRSGSAARARGSQGNGQAKGARQEAAAKTKGSDQEADEAPVVSRSAVEVRKEIKGLYDEELRKMGFKHASELQLQESEALYNNVLNNRKRLELLNDWWGIRTGPTTGAPR
jgi:hypothetical protein